MLKFVVDINFDSGRHTVDGRPTEKITFLSLKSRNSSRTSIKKIEFSVHEANTFITIVNRKFKKIKIFLWLFSRGHDHLRIILLAKKKKH
jgi:hypothetical protein